VKIRNADSLSILILIQASWKLHSLCSFSHTILDHNVATNKLRCRKIPALDANIVYYISERITIPLYNIEVIQNI